MESIETPEFIFMSYEIKKLILNTDNDIVDGVHIKINSDLKTYDEEKKVLVIMTIMLTGDQDKKNLILSITSNSSFKYRGSKKFQDLDQKSILALVNVTYDTTRGIIIEKFANSKFQKLILPIASDEALGITYPNS